MGSKLKTVLPQWEGQEKFRIPGKQPRCDQNGGKGHWEARNKYLPAYIPKQCWQVRGSLVGMSLGSSESHGEREGVWRRLLSLANKLRGDYNGGGL